MLKVLIVDDEYLQRELVKTSIAWETLAMELAGEAEDGRQALALFEKIKPDIVIMDINIPFVNGIEVSKSMRAAKPETQILIVTAYGEFDYAKDALNLGAAAFVLKPLSQKELHDKLLLVKQNIEAAAEQKERLLELQYKKQRMEKEQLLLEGLSGLSGNDSLTERCRLAGIPYEQKTAVLEIRFSGEADQRNAQEGLEEYLKEQFPTCECIGIGKDILTILFSGQTEEEFQVRLFSVCQSLNEDMEQQKGSRGGISGIHPNIQQLPKAYREAHMLVNQQRNKEESAERTRIRRYEPTGVYHSLQAIPYRQEELLKHLRAREYDQIYEEIEKVYAELAHGHYMREAAVYIAMDIMLCVLSYLADFDLHMTAGQEQSMTEALRSAEENKDIQDILCSFVAQGIELIAKYAAPPGNRKAHEAQKYIEENYSLPELSLNTVSEKIGINPSYLSNIFKKEFQCSLSRQIITVRLRQAVRYMRENPKAVLSDVAEKVGYADVYYFSKSFKSFYGISPSHYLEEHNRI